jgi:uncharacterized surface protein with fasciclin (FAS1) repeats
MVSPLASPSRRPGLTGIGLLSTQPQLVSALVNARNITILAPSNAALLKYLNDSSRATAVAQDPSLLVAILSYHVLSGTYYASSFTSKSAFIPTLLTNETYANITGGQRVEALLRGGGVSIFSGLKEASTVVTAVSNHASTLTSPKAAADVFFIERELYRRYNSRN